MRFLALVLVLLPAPAAAERMTAEVLYRFCNLGTQANETLRDPTLLALCTSYLSGANDMQRLIGDGMRATGNPMPPALLHCPPDGGITGEEAAAIYVKWAEKERAGKPITDQMGGAIAVLLAMRETFPCPKPED